MHEKKIYFGNCVGLINSEISENGILFYSGFLGDKDESNGLFSNFIPILQHNGFSTLRYDASGIGESKVKINNITISEWIRDSYNAIDLFFQSGIKKVGLIGFSLGTTYNIFNYLRDEKDKSRIKGIALWAPVFNPKRDMLNRYKKNGDYERSKAHELIKNNKLVSTKLLDSLDFDIEGRITEFDAPILLCHSKQDQYIPVSSSELIKDKIQNLDEFVIVNNASHSFRELDQSEVYSKRMLVYDKTLKFFKIHLD